jgi:hypothetical protein
MDKAIYCRSPKGSDAGELQYVKFFFSNLSIV